jgi:hypothetical protein
MSLTIDDRTVAGRPGGVRLQFLRYVQYFPLWPSILGGWLLGGTVICFWSLNGLWLVLPAAALIGLYWSHLKSHFAKGCMNPAVVMETKPLLIGVYSDLSNGDGSYPTIKLLRHPSRSSDRFNVGQRCLTVSLYEGRLDCRHWEDFSPKLVISATGDPSVLSVESVSIPEEDWNLLEQAIPTLPQPWKPGLYPIAVFGSAI